MPSLSRMLLILWPTVTRALGLDVWQSQGHRPKLDQEFALELDTPRALLPGGGKMPMAGLGLGGHRGETAYNSTFEFLMLGGRLLDTAQHYLNHQEVGKALKTAIEKHRVRREDVFLTTKIPAGFFGSSNSTFRWVRKMLRELDVSYIDLVLLHAAGRDEKGPQFHKLDCGPTWKECREEVWRGLSRAQSAGLVRALGVSNFGARQIKGLMDLKLAPVAMNQLEYHPWVPEAWRSVVGFCKAHGIDVTAFGSVLRGGGPRKSGTVNITDCHAEAIGKTHGKTADQVLLRWAIQQNLHVIPASTKPEHMKDNLDIFDFQLSQEEMDAISSVPESKRFSMYPHYKTHLPDNVP